MRCYHVEFVYVIPAMCSISVIVIVVLIILMASSSPWHHHVLVSKVILVASKAWGLGLPIAMAGHANVTQTAIRKLQMVTVKEIKEIANCHNFLGGEEPLGDGG